MMLNQNSVRYVYSYLYIYTDLHEKKYESEGTSWKNLQKRYYYLYSELHLRFHITRTNIKLWRGFDYFILFTYEE